MLKEQSTPDLSMEALSHQNNSPPRVSQIDIYNPGYLSHKTRTQNNVEAFTQKIDFSTVELRKTNLPYLEAEKLEYFGKIMEHNWK